MGSFGTKNATSTGTSNGTSTTTLSPEVKAAYDSLLSQITGQSGTNTAINNATSDLTNLSSTSNPSFATASSTLQGASAPASASIGDYLSPYLNGALQAQEAVQNQQNAAQQQQVIGNAAAQGALGGNRVGVAQGQLALAQNLANNQANSSLINNAYQQATGAALQGQQNQTAVGNAQANLGSQQNQASLGNILGLLQAGQVPYSNLGTLASIASGLSNSGATISSTGNTTSTVPQGNILSQLLGTGLSIASLFAKGGRVGYATGGAPGFGDMGEALAAALQTSGQAIQSANDNNSSANDNQPFTPTSQEKQGATNIKNWLFPSAKPAAEVGGSPIYARGGTVKRYASGGFADAPYALFDNGLDDSVGLDATPSIGDMLDVAPDAAAPARVPRVSASLGSAPALPWQATASLSAKNFNPGNITVSPWTMKQPGYAGSNGGFAVFDSPQAGEAAMTGLLSNYIDSGHNTLSSIISKWSPQATNAPGSTANYINYVATRTGIDPNAPLDQRTIPAIAGAMSEFESGARPSGPVSSLGSPAGAVAQNTIANFDTHGQLNDVVASPQPGLGMMPSTFRNVSFSGQTPQQSNSIGDVISSLQAGKGLNLSDDMRYGLLSAGLGMMSSKSPFALSGIGEGGLAGLQAYMDRQKMLRENAEAASNIGAQQLSTEQAARQLELNAAQTASDINAQTAQAGATNVEAAKGRFVPSPVGMLQYDPNDPNAPPKVIPWNQLGGMPGGNGQQPEQPATDEHGFVTQAPAATSFNPLLFNPDTAKLVTDQTQRALSGAQNDATSSQALNAQLGELVDLAKKLPTGGLLAQGAGFQQRLDFFKGINSTLQTLGMAPLSPDDVATAEGLTKIATQLQGAVANQWSDDPAASTIARAAKAAPSGENTQQAMYRIVGNIDALSKRSIDRYAFLQDWANKHYGDITGADVAFNQANPPQKYVQYGQDIAKQMSAPSAGSQGNPIVPKTQSDINNAPSGTVFNIDGKLMVKP